MPEEKENPAVEEEVGEIRISTEVITVIAHTVAGEVEGVAGMSANIAENISSALGIKNSTKGVRVEIDEKNITIDLYIFVEYGARIPDVAWKIQEKVKSAVENMTGMNVASINIHVQGVSFDKTGKESQKQEEQK